MAFAIETRELSKSFANCKALDKVSLQISEGEMVALLGASGSGKSTLLRHLPGFITSTSGEIDVLGKTVQANGQRKSNFKEVRNKIGFVFQQFNLVNRLPVITNVLIGLLHETPWWRSLLMRFTVKQLQAAIEALASVGIEQTAWQRASTLSGGQQQRLCIARSLAVKPRVLLMDEPCSALDPGSTLRIEDTIGELAKTMTIIIVTHNMQQAARVSDYTAFFLSDGGPGQMVEVGPTSEIFSRPRDKRTENYVSGRFG